MIANCGAVILPGALIQVWSAPVIAARLSFARMSSTSNVTGSVSARILRMKSTTAWRYRSTEAPHHHLDLEYEIGVEQGGNLGRESLATADPFPKVLFNGDVLLGPTGESIHLRAGRPANECRAGPNDRFGGPSECWTSAPPCSGEQSNIASGPS